MAKKKPEEVEQEPREVETAALVLGAGPSGLAAAESLAREGVDFLVLENAERAGGAAATGLHLRDAIPGETGILGEARVRWDRRWVSFDEVPLDHKDWAFKAPQWSLYLKGAKALWKSEAPSEELAARIRYRSPVSSIFREGSGLWKLETPRTTYRAPRVIWAAGLTAFQNAVGKIEAQAFLTGNPIYDAEAADLRGGVGFDLTLKRVPVFEEGFDATCVFGLPVRHGGKLYLTIGVALVSEVLELRTLTHLPAEILTDAKELSSFQKSLRRSLKMLVLEGQEDAFEGASERWVVSPRVGGHERGTAWLFGAARESLEFTGDESSTATPRLGAAQSLPTGDASDARVEIPA
jgi:hypothetical protein